MCRVAMGHLRGTIGQLLLRLLPHSLQVDLVAWSVETETRALKDTHTGIFILKLYEKWIPYAIYMHDVFDKVFSV